MNEIEKTLLFFDNYFKKNKVDYMLFASSLLHIIREGHLIPEDLEIDIIVHGKDLTDELIEQFKKDNYYWPSYTCHEKYPEFYLFEKPCFRDNGYLALNPLWLKDDVCYQNMKDDDCMLWNKKYYPKESWSTINYLDREFKVPANPEEWLALWYGDDWRIPKTMNWTQNTNYRSWNKLGL